MTTKSKTFADRMLAEAREIDGQNWLFGQLFVREGLEGDLIAGLKAFAKLWFLELTGETQLPAEFYRLVDVITEFWLADTSELEDDEEDEDEESE